MTDGLLVTDVNAEPKVCANDEFLHTPIYWPKAKKTGPRHCLQNSSKRPISNSQFATKEQFVRH